MLAARLAPRACLLKFAFSQLAVYSKNSSNGISSPRGARLGLNGGQKIAAEPQTFQTAEELDKNIGSSRILILGKENF